MNNSSRPPSRRFMLAIAFVATSLVVFVILAFAQGTTPPGVLSLPAATDSIGRFNIFCTLGAVSSLLCILLLLTGRQRARYKGRPYGIYDLLALLPGAVLIFAMGGVIINHPKSSEFTRESDPEIQEKVCDAARNNRPQDLVMLLNRGADPDSCEEVGDDFLVCALTMAVTHRNTRCVDILLSYGASPDGAGSTGYTDNTPIEAAVMAGDVTILRSLIKAGGHPLEKDSIAVKAAIHDHKVLLYPGFLESGVYTDEYNQMKEQAINSNNSQLLKTLQQYQATPRR